MKDQAPNTFRPKNHPADMREVIADGFACIADELDKLIEHATNGDLEILKAIGELKFAFVELTGKFERALEVNQAGHAKTQGMLSRLLGEQATRDEDFEAFKEATNLAIAEIRRKFGNGHATT